VKLVTMRDVPWAEGRWSVEPESVQADGSDLLVTPRGESDLWRTTSYGFVHDDGPGLLVDFPDESATEVSFILDFNEQFDQAGILVRADERHWVKAGSEYADGVAQVGAVVTREVSDWSTAPTPQWQGRVITVRASRRADALTIRARAGSADWHLVRLAPIDPGMRWYAGPFCCSPSHGGLTVRFTRFATGAADDALHD
jgi:regulation of enolase protein 1 (concanavalin A-like superfamily)